MECMTYVAFNWANKAQLPLPALDMPHKESCSKGDRCSKREERERGGRECGAAFQCHTFLAFHSGSLTSCACHRNALAMKHTRLASLS